MPKIQTTPQRRYRYEIIAKAEGEQCLACKIEKGIRRGPPRNRLVIEHADNDESNWAWGNIHLICYSHNKKFEKIPVKDKISLLQAYSDQNLRERERENLSTWETVFKDMLPYEQGSLECQLSKRYIKRWRQYVSQTIKQEGSYDKRMLIRNAGKYAGCSLQTSRNYLELDTSEEGPYREKIDDEGNVIIEFKFPLPPGKGGKR